MYFHLKFYLWISLDFTHQRNVSLVSDVVKLGLPSLDNVIPRDGYILSYNRGSRTPNWVLEHLTRERVKAVEGVNRDKCDFKPDQAIHPFFRYGVTG